MLAPSLKRKPPNPFFLVLRLGYPSLPLYLPAFLRSTRRKKCAKARSRWRSASCAAHLETAYSQGTAVGLSAFNSRCNAIALGLRPVVRYSSCLRCRPQLYAQRAAPACCLHAVVCSFVRSSSTL